jgi:hypothetical protein
VQELVTEVALSGKSSMTEEHETKI